MYNCKHMSLEFTNQLIYIYTHTYYMGWYGLLVINIMVTSLRPHWHDDSIAGKYPNIDKLFRLVS